MRRAGRTSQIVGVCLISLLMLGASDTATAAPVVESVFRFDRLNIFIFATFFSAAVLWYIYRAQRGDPVYVRPLNGLNAVDEAIGRATEMGRPIIFIPGTGELDQILTIAGLSVLGYVAHATARCRATLRVPVLYPLAMAAARETVEQSYRDEGIHDPLDPQTVQYVAGESFSYAARIGGMMSRERPAAAIYMGQFHAEALLIAEMGQSIGAIQIAGTSEPEQLPFFIAACDYTLIGEEFFVASAYLANEPRMLGAVKGQDLMKIAIALVILAGAISVTFGWQTEFWAALLKAE